MTLAELNRFCGKLPHTTHVVQWGGADVWKVAGKVFVIGRWDEEADQLTVSFKTSDMAFEMLREMPGLRPAPYLASRGLKWIQRFEGGTLDDAGLRGVIAESHALVAAGLPKTTRVALGLEDEATTPALKTTRRPISRRAAR